MDFEKELMRPSHKEDWARLAAWIGIDKDRFSRLMESFFSKNNRVAQKASTILRYCFPETQELLEPYMKQMVDNLGGTQHDAVVRNTFRIFQFVDVPDELSGKLLDKAFLYFGDEQQPVAIHVFAMTVIYNLSLEYPELQEELAIMIEQKMPYGSSGFKNRGAKILKKIRNGSRSRF